MSEREQEYAAQWATLKKSAEEAAVTFAVFLHDATIVTSEALEKCSRESAVGRLFAAARRPEVKL